MGQKDLTQKNLEDYSDVFADIVNALLYEGEAVVSAESLQSAPTETLYLGKDKRLRNQFHDVKKTDAIYPVISLVLHWGKRKWQSETGLRNFFCKKGVPNIVVKYIDNVRLYVYDMRYLSGDMRKRFTSDMRMIVDYLAEGEAYKPTKQPIRHVEAFLLFMRAISGDKRYEQMILNFEKQEEGEITMCGLLDKYEAMGIEKGIEKGEGFLAKLIENLFRDKRMEDARLVLTDVDARKRLYQEYGIC